MIEKILKKIKRIWCSLKCCFESKCSMDNTENNDNDVPDEIKENIDNIIYKLKNNPFSLDEEVINRPRSI